MANATPDQQTKIQTATIQYVVCNPGITKVGIMAEMEDDNYLNDVQNLEMLLMLRLECWESGNPPVAGENPYWSVSTDLLPSDTWSIVYQTVEDFLSHVKNLMAIDDIQWPSTEV